MKNNYLRVIGITALAGSSFLFMSNRAEFSFETYHSSKMFSSGASAGNTGAPGETNCTMCHSGSVMDGTTINMLELASGGMNYVAGAINSMTLTMTDNSALNGFQLVALDVNNDMAGSFNITDGTNTKLITGGQGGRSYVSHTSSGNNQSTWSFDWDAPSNNSDVTFYVATNKTDLSGSTSGDVIYLSTHVFNNSLLSVNTESIDDLINVGYSTESHSLILNFPVISNNDVTVNVIDLSGKSIYFNNKGSFSEGEHTEKLRLPESMDNGIYVVTLFIGNQPHSKKVLVNR